MELPAQCPYCKTGCDKCHDGFIVVTLPEEGDWYTRQCDDCGEGNGACHGDYLDVVGPAGPCVWCGSENVKWRNLMEEE